MRIGIVGNGVVGSALGKVLSETGHEVGFWDKNPDRRTHAAPGPLLNHAELTFVCLPTPQREGSLECDTSSLDDFFRWAGGTGFNTHNFVIKSTVPVGYTRKVWGKFPNVVHSPEFLTARTAIHDVKHPRLNVVGLPSDVRPLPEEHWLVNLYSGLNRRTPIALTGSNTSELLKLALNSFFAVKVAYWNEVEHFAAKNNVDYEALRQMVITEGRVHPLHTQVPGPDGMYGFGGTCLPKDLASLIYQLESENLAGSPRADYQTVLSAAYFGNQEDRKREIK